MRSCIVTVVSENDGLYQEWGGCREGVVGHYEMGGSDPSEMGHKDCMRRIKTWFCSPADVDAVVKKLSEAWAGYEVKVFNLASVSIAMPGELKHKSVTKDGVLPV
jgi:hypothetical protein